MDGPNHTVLYWFYFFYLLLLLLFPPYTMDHCVSFKSNGYRFLEKVNHCSLSFFFFLFFFCLFSVIS